MGVVIRKAEESDLDGVVAVGRRTWPVTYVPIAGDDYVAMGLAKWWTPDACRPAIRTGRTTVADLDGQVVGVAVVGPHGGALVLWKLYVLPEHQGEGIGRALMRAVLAKAASDGADRIRLAHIEGNETAHRFYLAEGFVDDEREVESDGVPDSMWMRRDLGGER